MNITLQLHIFYINSSLYLCPQPALNTASTIPPQILHNRPKI